MKRASLGFVQHERAEVDRYVIRKLWVRRLTLTSGEPAPALENVGALRTCPGERPGGENATHATGDHHRDEPIIEPGVRSEHGYEALPRLAGEPRVVNVAIVLEAVLLLERQ